MDLWSRYQGRALSSEGLDTALGAFDMFVLHDQEQDLDYVRYADAVAKREVSNDSIRSYGHLTHWRSSSGPNIRHLKTYQPEKRPYAWSAG